MKKIFFVFIFSILLSSCGKKEILNTSEKNISIKSQWPQTVEEAVDDILAHMNIEDKERIRNTKKEDLITYHHGWGTGIRNAYGLWAGNKSLMKDTKANHPDDASMVIIKAVWAKLQK